MISFNIDALHESEEKRHLSLEPLRKAIDERMALEKKWGDDKLSSLKEQIPSQIHNIISSLNDHSSRIIFDPDDPLESTIKKIEKEFNSHFSSAWSDQDMNIYYVADENGSFELADLIITYEKFIHKFLHKSPAASLGYLHWLRTARFQLAVFSGLLLNTESEMGVFSSLAKSEIAIINFDDPSSSKIIKKVSDPEATLAVIKIDNLWYPIMSIFITE